MHALLIQEHDLRVDSVRIIVWKWLNVVFGGNCIEGSVPRHLADTEPAIVRIVCVLLHKCSCFENCVEIIAHHSNWLVALINNKHLLWDRVLIDLSKVNVLLNHPGLYTHVSQEASDFLFVFALFFIWTAFLDPELEVTRFIHAPGTIQSHCFTLFIRNLWTKDNKTIPGVEILVSNGWVTKIFDFARSQRKLGLITTLWTGQIPVGVDLICTDVNVCLQLIERHLGVILELMPQDDEQGWL